MNRMTNGLSDSGHPWAVILAGGDGTRLRDLSYMVSGDQRPKQSCSFSAARACCSIRGSGSRLSFLHRTPYLYVTAHEICYQRQLSDARPAPLSHDRIEGP
jgi:mannose-1-phosphate guanylyltransferase